MIKFVLFYTSREEKEVKEILSLLEKVESTFNVEVERKRIKEFGEKQLKTSILLPLSVSKRIRIRQTQRTRSLYTQLVVFLDDEPFTYYPQTRSGEKEITIKEFLERLLEGEVKCLHDATELKERLRRKE